MTDPCVQLAIAVSAATADHGVQGCDTHPCDLCAALSVWAVSTKHAHRVRVEGTDARTAQPGIPDTPDTHEASQGEYPPIPDNVCPATGGTHLTHAGVCARCGQTRGTYLIGRDNPDPDPVNAILDAPAHATSQPAQPIQPGSPHA